MLQSFCHHQLIGDRGSFQYTGSEEWTARLADTNGWQISSPWSPWMVDGGVGGYVTSWAAPSIRGFSFATVFGAGHMVPETRPGPALALFHRFLGGGPYNDPAGENSRGHGWLAANRDQLGNTPVGISQDPVTPPRIPTCTATLLDWVRAAH